MRFFTALMLLVGAVVLNGPARADSDDKLWVAQCIRDNAGSEVSTAVLFKYCKCMTNKMDDEETRSVTDWEPTHPDEKAVCRTKAKWDAPAPPQVPTPAPAPAPVESPPPQR